MPRMRREVADMPLDELMLAGVVKGLHTCHPDHQPSPYHWGPTWPTSSPSSGINDRVKPRAESSGGNSMLFPGAAVTDGFELESDEPK
jgi:hypothetical protein